TQRIEATPSTGAPRPLLPADALAASMPRMVPASLVGKKPVVTAPAQPRPSLAPPGAVPAPMTSSVSVPCPPAAPAVPPTRPAPPDSPRPVAHPFHPPPGPRQPGSSQDLDTASNAARRPHNRTSELPRDVRRGEAERAAVEAGARLDGADDPRSVRPHRGSAA